MGNEFDAYELTGHESLTARWLIGTDVNREQQYLVHLGAPTFVAKVSDDQEVGMLSTTSYGMADGRNIYDFIFYRDQPGSKEEFLSLMLEAEAAVLAVDAE